MQIQTANRLIALWICCVSVCLILFPVALLAQTDAGFPRPTKTRVISDVAAYNCLIHLIVEMDNSAQELDSKNIEHGLRKAMNDKLGFDSHELEMFLQDCHRAHDKIKQLDEQAKGILKQYKTPPSLPDSTPRQMSGPPAELVMLNEERHAAVRGAMFAFEAHLSAMSRQKLGRYIQSLVGNVIIIRSNPSN